MVIYIEPGMAFGTGLHVTTQFCLRMIEAAFSNNLENNFAPNFTPDFAPCRVLDVGTGSGILSILCALLHKESEITALDIDGDALRNASENLAINNVSERINLHLGTTADLKSEIGSERFDCIFSNLTSEDIIALLPEYERLCSPGALAICAGIVEEKLPQLEKVLIERGWKILTRELNKGWAGLVLKF